MNYFYSKHFHVSNLVKVWIKLATNAFSFLKRFKGSNPVKNKTQPNRYWLISKELNLEIGVNKNIPFVHTDHWNDLSKHRNTGTELVLDPNTISFKEIINFMSENGNGFSYKILSSDKNHAVGSNSSNAKGEVLVMS